MDLYYQHQPLIQTGDIIEWRSRTLVGWLIRKKTGQNVNHTSGALIYILEPGTDRRRYIGEAIGKGFVSTLLSDKLKSFKGTAYLYQLKPEYDAHRAQIAAEALALEGRGYGFWDLLKNIKGPVKVDDKKVFCSEAWQIALINAGLLPENFNNGLALVPGELDKTGLYLPSIKIYEKGV